MKIGNKLTGAFLMVALLVAAVGLTGIWGLGKLMDSADYILDEKVPLADASMEATIDLIHGRDLMGEFNHALEKPSGRFTSVESEVGDSGSRGSGHR